MKSKGGGKLSVHFSGDYDNVELIFALLSLSISSVSTEQSQICVKNSSLHWQIQGDRLAAINKSKSTVETALNIQRPLLTNEQAQGDLLQNHKEQVENLPNHEQLIKLCTDAGFIKTVAPGQHFMTKDAEEFSQFDGHVACREYTLPRDEESSKPKGWIRGNTKIGPILEVVTNCHQGKHNVEIRIEPSSKDGSHSKIRISFRVNKFVRDLTEKFRIHEDNEDTSASAGRPVSHDSKIFENSRMSADQPAAKARPNQASSPFSSSSPTGTQNSF